MSKVVGHWKLEKNENWDEYMQALGVNLILRKVGNTITNYEEIKRDGNQFEISITSTFKNKTVKFTLGVEFDDETIDGRKVKNTYADEDGKLVLNQRGEGGPAHVVRELIDDNTMVQTLTLLEKNITAKRIYKRYKP